MRPTRNREKEMKKIAMLFVFICTLNANAQQIHRNQWTVQPHVKSNAWIASGFAINVRDWLLAGVAGTTRMTETEYVEFIQRNSWYIPEFEFGHPIYSISSADGAKLGQPLWWRELLWGDYSHTFDFSAGYEFAWKSLISPFGAYIGVDWEYQQLEIKNSAEAGMHRSQAVVPSAGLRLRMWGGNFEKTWKPVMEIGAAYVHHFKYNNPNDYGLDALNNGMRGKIAIGIEYPDSHSALVLQYEHDFFDLFNNDYVDANGVKPFAEYKNTFGLLTAKWSRTF